MPERQAAIVIDPSAVFGSGEVGPYPFELFHRKCLAQGDSWFSLGALPPTRTTRLVAELRLTQSTVIVNCAQPGAVLRRMTDTTRSPQFLRLLTGNLAIKWDTILISGGGNDVIDAAAAPPTADPARRLFRTPDERGPGASAGADYISAPGWATFSDHLGVVFNRLIDLRDSGVNRRTPLVWHNYARVMPRPSPAGLGFGPWLLPSLDSFSVPPDARLAVADELLGRLRRLIDDLTAARKAADPTCNVYVADSMSQDIVLADGNATDVSGDWINEIHLTRAGYRKAAQAWQQVLDVLLA
jgi:hypothetical protein